jgi:hypothetical protein
MIMREQVGGTNDILWDDKESPMTFSAAERGRERKRNSEINTNTIN